LHHRRSTSTLCLKFKALFPFGKDGTAPSKRGGKVIMKLEKIINSGIPIFCGTLLFLIVILTFMQVILRNCFNSNLNWSDEISQFSMMWLVLFGIIWATKNDRHLNTGFKLHKKLNKKLIGLIDCILDLLLSGVAGVVVYQSAVFTILVMGTASLSLSWLKMGYIVILMPLSMLGVCYYYLKSFCKNLVSIFKN
jgi:TRAP-type C4-dicarboxylate transport system permease small subunit